MPCWEEKVMALMGAVWVFRMWTGVVGRGVLMMTVTQSWVVDFNLDL